GCVEGGGGGMGRAGGFPGGGEDGRMELCRAGAGAGVAGGAVELLKCPAVAPPPGPPPPGPRSKRIRGGWALEAAGMVLALYPVYGWIRDLVGVSRADA